MPKYEKVNDSTIRVIREHGVDITLYQLLKNKETLLKQESQVKKALVKIEKILREAKRLKITSKIPSQPSAQGEPTIIYAP